MCTQTEHGTIQCVCSLWRLWRNLHQQTRRQMDTRLWRCRVLYLRHQLTGVCSRRCRWVQPLCWHLAWDLCRSAVDCAGDNHDLLPKGEPKGTIFCLVLGNLQHGSSHWQSGKFQISCPTLGSVEVFIVPRFNGCVLDRSRLTCHKDPSR